MKTFIAALALVAACAVYAQHPATIQCPQANAIAAEAAAENWDFVSVAFFPNVPPSAGTTDVYGLKIGLPVSFGEAKVVGVEGGFIASTTKRVKGIQGAIFYNEADKVSGLQACPIVNVAKNVNGVQAGIVNVATDSAFQFGLINYIENSSVPFFPIVNFKF